MQKNYTTKHPELWKESLAMFSNHQEYLIDLIVTIIDSKYDDYYRVRDAFIGDPELLAEYNNLKRQYEGKLYAEYREAKMNFLGGNGKVKFLDYD